MKHRRTRLVAGSGNPAAALALGPGSATALGRVPAAAAWMVPAGIALVVIACFLPTLRNDFVLWDDDLNFTDNPSYRGLSWRQLRWMFTTVHGGHYQPLSWVTLGLDYTLWGMNPTGYHFTSLQAGEVIAGRIHAPQGVVEPERHPAEGLVVSPVDGREHPAELTPGQAPIARVVGEVEVVVPQHEVVAQGRQEAGDHHERDPRRDHPGGGCGTTTERGRAPGPERKSRSRVPRASDQSSTAVLHGARPPVVAASTISN